MQAQPSSIIDEPTELYPVVTFSVSGDKLYLVNSFRRPILVSVDLDDGSDEITYDLRPGARVRIGSV